MGRNSWKLSVNDSVAVLNQAARDELDSILRKLTDVGLPAAVVSPVRKLADTAQERYQVYRYTVKRTATNSASITLKYSHPTSGSDPDSLVIPVSLDPGGLELDSEALPDWLRDPLDR